MSILSDLLSSRIKAEVFRLLFGPVKRELHVRELERRAGLSLSTVRQELKRLSRVGVVTARKDGNRTYYKANSEHPLFTEICGLVLKTSGLVEVLQEALRGAEIRVAFVFGSVASHSEKAHSDIDVMVLGNVSSRKVSGLLYGLESRVGRAVNPHVLSVDEFLKRKNADDHFLTSVLDAPKLFILGDAHELARLGEERVAQSAPKQPKGARGSVFNRKPRS